MKLLIKTPKLLLTLLAAFYIGSVAAHAAVTVAAPNSTLDPDSWGLSGAALTSYRAALLNPAHFGPAGTVNTSITIQDLNPVNAASLSGVGLFISPYWSDSQSASSVAAIVTFFLNGGNLFLLQDDSGVDAIGQALGIPTVGTSGTDPTTVLHSALANGSFGLANSVFQGGTQGILSASNIAAKNGTIGATDANGKPTMAVWDYGDYALGAGRMVIFADVDFISNNTSGGQSTGYVFGSLNQNEKVALNATEFLLQARPPQSGQSVPDGGSTIAILGLALTAVAGARRKFGI